MLHHFTIDLVMDDNAEMSGVPLSSEELENLKRRIGEQARRGFGITRGTRRHPLYPVVPESATATYHGTKVR